MPNPRDITGDLHRIRERGQLKKDVLPEPMLPTPMGRKLRVDWFFRSCWILAGLFLLAQLGIVLWGVL